MMDITMMIHEWFTVVNNHRQLPYDCIGQTVPSQTNGDDLGMVYYWVYHISTINQGF